MAKAIRIAILLFVLFVVAQGAWMARSRTTNWKETLRVVVYPINGDASTEADAHIKGLRGEMFEPIAAYLRAQAREYKLPLQDPVEIYLAPPVASTPPAPPRQGSAIEIMLWSLHLRYWAWRHDGYSGPKGHVRMFVLYFAPRDNRRLAHSVGLQKGLLGVVNAFAAAHMEGENKVVIAHELLHTFGATDKYDAATNLPRFPDGYADPNANPRYPQSMAEIMAGRVPLSATSAETPPDLEHTLIGAASAREINWLK
jgi:hypothetical protein